MKRLLVTILITILLFTSTVLSEETPKFVSTSYSYDNDFYVVRGIVETYDKDCSVKVTLSVGSLLDSLVNPESIEVIKLLVPVVEGEFILYLFAKDCNAIILNLVDVTDIEGTNFYDTVPYITVR